MDDTLYIKGVSDAEKHRRAITNRTVVMVGSNGNRDRVGNTFLANRQVIGHLLASFLIGIEPIDDVCERFLSSSLRSHRIQSLISKSTSGSTGIKNLGLKWLRNLELLIPPITEQRSIADVLDAIDEAIERTEAVISATERLRDALLHELLTCGVPGWHTEWRTVPGLGIFPADWRAIELRDVGQLRYGTSKQLSSTSGGYAILRIPNVAPGYLDTSVLKFADLSQCEADFLSLRSGDLLIVRTNGNPEICGQSVVFDGREGKWAFASYLLRLRIESRVLSPVYLWAFLHSTVGRRQLRANVQTSAGNYNLSVEGLASVRMALPEIEEQVRIVEVVQSLADSLAREAYRIVRLRSLRSSVSDALLSGRVRTTVVRELAKCSGGSIK